MGAALSPNRPFFDVFDVIVFWLDDAAAVARFTDVCKETEILPQTSRCFITPFITTNLSLPFEHFGAVLFN
jgi:hypothetical protein